jgi:hypothetical protein
VVVPDAGEPLSPQTAHLEDGNPAEGATRLREALAIYQRIGALNDVRVQETLRDQGSHAAAALGDGD